MNTHEYTVFSSFMFANDSLNGYIYNKNFYVYQEDLRNITSIKKYISNNDVIVPLACLVVVPLGNLKEIEA